MATLWEKTKAFFFAEVQTIKGFLNLNELVKTVLTALLASSGFVGLLTALQASLASIITDPNVLKTITDFIASVQRKDWVTVGVAVTAFILEAFRRLNHGVDPAPVKKN